jgi:signal transduction histidine kinase
LTGMRERAMLIGAGLDIASTPGAGVMVTLRLPLNGGN